MFIVKCIPFVGTAVAGTEAVRAAIDGDGKKCAAKLAETGVGAAMDTVFVDTGGAPTVATAPLKVGAVQAGAQVLVRGFTDYLAEKVNENDIKSTRNSSGGGDLLAMR